MTLSPIENRRVRGVAAERYPLNPVCAVPGCTEATDDPHHIFRRTLIGNDSWFVVVHDGEPDSGEGMTSYDTFEGYSDPIPHVTGLCRAHHDDVDEHRAWIRLEEGEFVWWERRVGQDYQEGEWFPIGPLDPQPGGREKTKKPRKRFQGEERRKRKTISIRVPDDVEDGGAIWDETLDEVKAKLIALDLYKETDTIPSYEALIAALRDWLNTGVGFEVVDG